MPTSIHQTTIDDIEQIVPLFDAYRQFYGRPPDAVQAREFLAERFRHQQSVIFLATDETGQALGFTQLYPGYSSLSMARIFILNDLFVLPRARRAGVGALLLERAAAFGRTMGAVRLTLSTAVDNVAAQKLYDSLGWERDEAFLHYDLALLSPRHKPPSPDSGEEPGVRA